MTASSGYLQDDDAIKLALANRGEDEYGYWSEFVELLRKEKVATLME